MSHDLAPVLGAIHYERDFDINGILRTVVKSLQVKGVKVGGVLQEPNFARTDTVLSSILSIFERARQNASHKIGVVIRAAASSTRAVSRRSLIALRTRSMPTWTWSLSTSSAEPSPKEVACCRALRMRLSAGVPILTTVREPYVAAWNLYHGGLAIELPPKIDAILRWYDVAYPHQNVKTLDRWPDLSCLQSASS